MFPPVLTEAQARQAVNLPPAGGAADAYTERLTRWVIWVTELADMHLLSTGIDVDTGLVVDLWPTTADLPERVTRWAEIVFRENWSVDIGAHGANFGADRYAPDPPTGPFWVVSHRAQAAAVDLAKPAFA
jgi:hypothetical protein